MDNERRVHLENEAYYYLTEIIKTAEHVRKTVDSNVPDFGSAANLGLYAAKASALVMAISELNRDNA